MKTSTRTLYLYSTSLMGRKIYHYPIRRLYLNDELADALCLRLNATQSVKNDMVHNGFRVLSNEALSVREIIAINS